jgi:hypothetical protein
LSLLPQLGKAINKLTKKVKGLEGVVYSPEKVADWCGSQLQLPPNVLAAARDVVGRAGGVLVSESFRPHALAGGALLLVCSTKRSAEALDGAAPLHPALELERVAQVTHISEPVLTKTHRKLFEHRAALLPDDFVAYLRKNNLELTL